MQGEEPTTPETPAETPVDGRNKNRRRVKVSSETKTIPFGTVFVF